jgi:putative ABC transport system permease protein
MIAPLVLTIAFVLAQPSALPTFTSPSTATPLWTQVPISSSASAPSPVRGGVAIERRLAERWRLAVGDTLELARDAVASSTRWLVEAIYQARPDPATALRGELGIRFHLADLATLLGAPDRVDRIGVKLVPGVSPDSAVRRLNQIGFGFRAYPSVAIAAESSKTFLVVSRFHRAIGFIAIVASAVFLLCIMLLKVEERRLDAAVMRMIGLSRRTVFRAFLLEAALLATVGSVVGTGMAYLATVITNGVYQRKFDTDLVFAHLTTDIVALGTGLSVALGLAAGSVAAGRLLRANPLALWRRAE